MKARFFALAAMLILPASCDAQTAPKPAAKRQQTAIPAPAPNPPARIGAFGLDRPISQGALALGWVPIGTKRLVVDGQDVRIARDGRFIVGFGRDYKATALFTAFRTDGTTVSEKMPVAHYAWKIDYLNTLPHHAQPDAEFQARRPGEMAQINAARRGQHDVDGWRQRFIWPAKGRISGFFGSQRVYKGEPGSPHSGVDVAGGAGAPVVSPAGGVVILAAASPFTLEGNLLMIDHGMGVNSAFLHLSHIDVKVGDVVQQGQRIGSIGMTGRATGPHLHWSMKWSDEKIDPQRFVGAM
jgi:murein DD-endopeptidase MepM/ murein hydrolase activator NlpD